MEMISLEIDGQSVKIGKGATLLEAARAIGVNIPTLCHLADLTPEGSCRVCVVEVEGARGLVTACTYPVSEGMNVRTHSAAIREARKSVVELILENHPQECLTCQRNLDCELQSLANNLGVREIRKEGERRQFAIDDSNPFIIRDNNKCILCGRCVRVCKEVQCCNTLEWTERGFDTKVTPAFDKNMADSANCVFCGTCVSACPVGALTEKAMNGVGTPDKKVKTTCPFCGVGCNYDLNVKDGKVIGVTSNLTSPVNGRLTCVKGRFGTDYIHSPERLTTPLIKKNGEFVEASWDEALDLIAAKFTEIKNAYGSDALAAVSSARCVNEDNYIMQKFMRAVIGTNNVDHCARICHAPTVAGLAASFGSGAMTNSIDELPDSKMIFLIGGNPTEAHPVIGAKMRQALRNGAKLIVADPRRIELAEKADVWMQLTPGTDIALLNGMLRIILKNGWHDQAFINTNTTGFDKMAEVIEKYTPEYVEAITGVPKHLLFEASKMYATAERASIFYTLGITEHTCGTDNVMSLANLAMLTGNVGKLFSGVNPMRGQNNVQGACDMGALPNVYSGYQPVTNTAAAEKFEKAWGAKMSTQVGLMMPDMFDAAIAGNLKAMYVMGEDPIRSDGDAHHVRKGFEHLEFLVVQNIFKTETGNLADVILPAASFAEKDGTFTNCERRVQLVRQAIDPIANSRADWQIIRDLSNKMGYAMSYTHPREIMDEMASLSPMFAGLSFDRVAENGLQWPVPTKEHPGSKFLHIDGKFTCGLGVFKAIEHQEPAELPDAEYPFLLTTGRILYHYCITTAGYSKQLTEYRPEERAMLHPDDAKRLIIENEDMITVTSRRGSVQAKAWVTDAVLPGGIWMSFHFQECATNEVTSGAGDKVTKTYEYKVCAVKVEKTAQ
ncbi:MAG TPA: formate dehydrogenase subunit alpha [Patescibacteria group bacterium]|nr:formate dehydrogenase subunit alpha [Patescibacteria group bacterium]